VADLNKRIETYSGQDRTDTSINSALIDVRWIVALDHTARRYGVDIEQAFNSSGDWQYYLSRPKVAMSVLETALQYVAKTKSAFDIVLDAGEGITANHMGVFGAFLYSAPSTDVMMKYLEEFSLIFCPTVRLVFIHRENENSELWMLRHQDDRGEPSFSNLGFSYYCIGLLTLIRSTQCQVQPQVEFFFERDPLDPMIQLEVEDRFNCKIYYGHKIRRIMFPASFIGRKCTFANNELNATLLKSMQYSVKHTLDSNLAEQIYQIFHEVGMVEANVDLVAQKLHVSTRTLMRKLKSESLSFRTLMDRYRLEKALSLSERPNANVTLLALELGFRDVSSFSRAFKRWTGESPKILFSNQINTANERPMQR
jgi:AraC-like DNA-binding protein